MTLHQVMNLKLKDIQDMDIDQLKDLTLNLKFRVKRAELNYSDEFIIENKLKWKLQKVEKLLKEKLLKEKEDK